MVPAFSSTSLLLESSSFQVLVRVLDPSASGRPASQPASLPKPGQPSPAGAAQRSAASKRSRSRRTRTKPLSCPLLPKKPAGGFVVGRVRWEGTLRSNFHVHWAARGKGWDVAGEGGRYLGTAAGLQQAKRQRHAGRTRGRFGQAKAPYFP